MRKLVLLPLVAALGIAGCGGDDDASGNTSTPVTSSGPTTTFAPKPEVSIPKKTPKKLKITEIKDGTGRKAKKGDLVLVHYVGVRSEDGTEFDTNFNKVEPLQVKLGAGGVIEGWDQGLVGVQGGGVRQLDIPAALAYGDQAPPDQDIIKVGDALSFVIQIDAVMVPPKVKKLEVEPSDGADETTTVDLVKGTGTTAEAGKTLLVHVLALRGDNEVVLQDTWAANRPQTLQLDAEATQTSPLLARQEDQLLLPGLVDGLAGMKVGGRRVVTMPPDDAFGSDGYPQLGLPRGKDYILVVDLLAVT